MEWRSRGAIERDQAQTQAQAARMLVARLDNDNFNSSVNTMSSKFFTGRAIVVNVSFSM